MIFFSYLIQSKEIIRKKIYESSKAPETFYFRRTRKLDKRRSEARVFDLIIYLLIIWDSNILSFLRNFETSEPEYFIRLSVICSLFYPTEYPKSVPQNITENIRKRGQNCCPNK